MCICRFRTANALYTFKQQQLILNFSLHHAAWWWSVVWIICGLQKYDHVSATHCCLGWLPLDLLVQHIMHLISYTAIILMMTVFSLIHHFNYSYGTRVTRLPPKFCVKYFSIPQLLDSNFLIKDYNLVEQFTLFVVWLFPFCYFILIVWTFFKFVIGFCMCVLIIVLFVLF